MNIRLTTLAPLAAAVAAAFALGACGQKEETAGQKVDQAVAQVEQKTEAAAQDIKQAAGEAGEKVAAAARDAAITASINVANFGVMPNWNTRLSEDEIRAVAFYVHSRGGGE